MIRLTNIVLYIFTCNCFFFGIAKKNNERIHSAAGIYPLLLSYVCVFANSRRRLTADCLPNRFGPVHSHSVQYIYYGFVALTRKPIRPTPFSVYTIRKLMFRKIYFRSRPILLLFYRNLLDRRNIWFPVN